MRVQVMATDLPGLTWDGHTDIHVALQVGREAQGLVPGDAATAAWETEVSVADGDFRGPAVQGKRGERFLYLTWGEVVDGTFRMFRRAKLMLADLGSVSPETHEAVGRISLTDARGGPLCGRIKPGAITWSVR